MNFYFEAAKVLDRLDTRQGSIKGILSTFPDKDRKRTAALVIETLKYKSVLLDVISTSQLLKVEKKITSPSLALVLAHDLLLSSGIQAGDGPVKQAILRHKTRLNGEFQKIKIKRGAKSNVELASTGDARAERIPRYVRVNTLKWTTEDAIIYFSSQGFKLGDPLQAKTFSRDEHISDLLLFPPQTSFHCDPAYDSGKIVLQDKASCFPATVLAPPASESSVVVDATAAPGNKTSHLSALMGNQGKLMAFERDRRRFGTLRTMLAKAGCSNTEALNVDFLTADPADAKFSKATHILLDPSCSGSGIVNRLDYLLETEEENDDIREERLNKLASFQLMMIRHAMKFPSVQRIVYSTCSIHATENEHVVLSALKSPEALAGPFVLAPRSEVLPTWHRRGAPDILDSPYTEAVIRCSPGEDATNGFFVSCFVRRVASATSAGVRRKDRDEATDDDSAPKANRRKKKKKSSSSKELGRAPSS